MGFFTLSVAGGGFFLIGAWETLASLNSNSNPNPNPSQFSSARSKIASFSSSPSFIFVFILSFLVIINSLVSFFDAINSNDRIGSSIQLPILAISSLFLFYSMMGLSLNFKTSIHIPLPILSLLALFAFTEEFLLFYLQRKDTSGIENRYFDLMLVPIMICIVSTILELKSPKLNYPKIVRGVGLVLQGTWFLQMGLSFFTNIMSNGCFLYEKSRANYTVKCKGHDEYHRARAIATLQFNCHLALLVVLVVGVYSVVSRSNGGGGDFTRYRPIGAEMQSFENHGQFTLDSDDDVGEENKEKNRLVEQKEGVDDAGTNGYNSHQ